MNKLVLVILFLTLSLIAEAQTFEKTYGGPNEEQGSSFQQTTDSGFIITGKTNSYGAGSFDVYLIRTDKNGDTLWTRTFGGTNSDYGTSVKQTADRGFIIAGVTTSFGAGSEDLYLIKTDSNGVLSWYKTFGTNQSEFAGQVVITADSGYCLVGSTGNVANNNPMVFLVKTNKNGDTAWTKKFGKGPDNFGYALKQTPDGGFIVSGARLNTITSNYEVYLIKTNNSGDSLWTKTYPNGNYGNDVIIASDGGYVIGGFSGPNFYALKTDAAGAIQWEQSIKYSGVNDRCNAIIEKDGGYILAGSTTSFESQILLMKVNMNGNLLWTKFPFPNIFADCSAIAATSGGGIALAGTDEGVHSNTGMDAFLIRMDCSDFPSDSIFTHDNTSFCQGDTISALLQSSVKNSSAYQWERNDSIIPGATSSSYLAKTTGSYSLTVFDSNGCSNESPQVISIYLSQRPTKPVIIQTGNTVLVAATFNTYQWYLNDSLIPGANNYNYTIQRSGRYKLCLNPEQCPSCSDEFDAIFNGVNYLDENVHVSFSPNPFNTTATLFIHTGNNLPFPNLQLIIYDMLGRQILQKNISMEQTEFKRGNLASGFYFYRLLSNLEEIANGKVEIE